MLKGETEVETLRFNGWGIGDVLEGTESISDRNGLVTWSNTSRIKITAIGEERFLCRWDNKCTGVWEAESGSTTLSLRDWKKILLT